MRVLLAGGAGFVGSHLADALLSRGDEVVAIDNLSTGRRSNLVHLYSNDRFCLVEHDVCYEFPDHIALAEPFDAVLDLASPASPASKTRMSATDPLIREAGRLPGVAIEHVAGVDDRA